MFRFADPNFLYLLILLPFLVALYLYSNYHRRQNIRKYGDPALLKGLMPTISKYRPDIKFWLIFAALTLVILMLARPQFGSKICRICWTEIPEPLSLTPAAHTLFHRLEQ